MTTAQPDFTASESFEPPKMALGFAELDSGLSPEQEVRRDIVLGLLRKGSSPMHVERDAQNLTKYVMDGPVDRTRYGRLPVFLPGGGEHPHEARAWMTKDGFLQIEFRDEDMGQQLLAILRGEDPLELMALHFSYIPAHPVDTTKDN